MQLELNGNLNGGHRPSTPPPTQEEQRQQRDELFAAHIRLTLFGLVRQQERTLDPVPPPEPETVGIP